MTRYEQIAYRTPNNIRKEVLQNILILTKEQVLKAVREKVKSLIKMGSSELNLMF